MVTAVVSTEGIQPLCRKSFSLKEKGGFVHAVKSIVSTCISCHQACCHLGLSSMYHTCFRKVIKRVNTLKNGAMFVPYKTSGNARKIHSGPPRVLSAIKEDLSRYVFETKQGRIQLKTCKIRQEACCLLPNFRGKSIVAKSLSVLCFTKRIGLSNRAATHTAQNHFQETKQESKHFIEVMKAKLARKDPCYIINMDQTPIPYSFHSNKMLESIDNRHKASYTRCCH